MSEVRCGASTGTRRRLADVLRGLHRALRLVVLAGAGWAGAGQAQSPPDCPPAAVELTPARIEAGMQAARDHGFLWRITKAGHSSFLYGTVHLARLEWMFPGPAVVDALRASDTLALELDVLDPAIRRRLTDGMATQHGVSLPDALAARLKRRIAAECLAPDAMAALSPELQAASLTALAARRDGLDPAYSIDAMLAGWGREARKPVVSLETPEAQLQALQSQSRDDAIALVRSGLDDLEAGRARPLLNRVASVWANGDYAELARYPEWCECRRTPAERQALKRLLDDRNPGLAAGIDALHANGRRVFAAVGSLHMVGPRGLPALLADRGFKVERIEFRR